MLSPLLDLLDGTHLMQSHLRPRPLSARNAGVLRARARARVWLEKATLTSDTSVNRVRQVMSICL